MSGQHKNRVVLQRYDIKTEKQADSITQSEKDDCFPGNPVHSFFFNYFCILLFFMALINHVVFDLMRHLGCITVII